MTNKVISYVVITVSMIFAIIGLVVITYFGQPQSSINVKQTTHSTVQPTGATKVTTPSPTPQSKIIIKTTLSASPSPSATPVLTPTVAPSIPTVTNTVIHSATPTINSVQDNIYPVGLTHDLQQFLQKQCDDNNWDYTLILSQIKRENSDFNPYLEHTNTNGTIDIGLTQLNSGSVNWYGRELANIKDFNPYNPKHSILACIAGMNYYRSYWQEQGITEQNKLEIYALNSYNMGIMGFKRYMNSTNTISRGYDRDIFRKRQQLLNTGRFVD